MPQVHNVVFLFLLTACAFSSYAKVNIIGELPTELQLLPLLTDKNAWQEFRELQTPNKTEYTSTQHKILDIHNTWLQPIHQYLQCKQTKTEKNSWFKIQQCHQPALINYFDQDDAQEILVPILKYSYNFELTPQQISEIFPQQAKIPLDKASNGSSSKPVSYFQQPKIAAALYNCAKKIAVHTRGATIISLGQSPSYVTEMLEVINRNLPPEKQAKIINLAYSGRPDYIRTNRSQDTWPMAFKHILTTDKLKFYREYLTTKGISPATFADNNGKVFLLDFSSGPSTSYFLLFLANWLQENNQPLPDIIFINLSAKEDIYLNKSGNWKPLSLIEDLDFKISDDLTITVDTFYLDMPHDILLDFANIQDELRLLPPFHPQLWNQKRMQQAFSQYPRPQAKQLADFYRSYTHQRQQLMQKKK